MKDKIFYFFKWIVYQGYMILPCIYLMALLAFNQSFSLRWLLFFLILGAFIRYAYIAWMRHDLEDDAIDFDFLSEEYPDSRQKSFKDYIKEMQYWERMHWVPVIIFLSLTCYIMIKGLQLLFVPSTATNVFIYIFSGVVTYTLFWLVLMISNRKKMWGFIIFYLLFDMMSAFCFNFVHFYDNVSGTQRRDADMKACRMYQDIQARNVNFVTEKAAIEKSEMAAREEQRSKEIRTLERQINSLRSYMSSQGVYEGKRKDRERLNSLLDRQKTLMTENTSTEVSLQANAMHLDSIGKSLNNLCLKYEDNSSLVSNEEVQDAKRQVQAMQIIVEQLERTGKLDSSFIVRNDTITYILRKIEAKGTDHFASIKSLFNAIFIDKEKEAQLKEEYCAGGGRALERFYEEEKSFENRLLYLSIALSSLIDLLPLFLGIFVSFIKGKKS